MKLQATVSPPWKGGGGLGKHHQLFRHNPKTILLFTAAVVVVVLTVLPFFYCSPLLQPFRQTSSYSVLLLPSSFSSFIPSPLLPPPSLPPASPPPPLPSPPPPSAPSPPPPSPPPPSPPPPSPPPPPTPSPPPPSPPPPVSSPPPPPPVVSLPPPTPRKAEPNRNHEPMQPLLEGTNEPAARTSVATTNNKHVIEQPRPQPQTRPSRPSSTTSPLSSTCDLTKGEWVYDSSAGPSYTNTTCWMIQEHQNCMKYGRPDMDFLKWRWKPEGCDLLPAFDPARFLEMMRGKSMAFVGDSLARNQMQSLMCLLSQVMYPKDISYTTDENFKRMYYSKYDFTIWIFWSPFLVRAEDPPHEGPNGLWKLHLDQADRTWLAHIAKFDYLILSGGNWFTRPSTYYQRRRQIGCNYCWPKSKKMRRLTLAYANRKAFQTAFQAIVRTKGYKGLTFLRTLSPAHFENGKWNEGGDCKRTKPYRKNEIRIGSDDLKFYKDQIEEFREAQQAGGRRGLKFVLLDTTQAMLLRPDGHPSRYGHLPQANVTLSNDCVHWCLPGPVDMWNDVLQQVLLSARVSSS